MSHEDSERAVRLEALLDIALELTASDRDRFLHSASVDPAFRERLSALLVAAAASGPLDRTSMGLASTLLEEYESGPSPAVIGQRLGRYRLIRLLGEGGMASVWLAERDGGDFQHQVAVKCLKTGMLTPDSRARFLREQHILARLHHVHIGRLFDAGISDEGMPFIVMEYIDGMSVIRHCEKHELDRVHRLRIFQKICAAVAYAHQNLIVHRDIKPSNILVDARGEPRLLDFGIAKLLDENGELPTRTGLQLFTPEYAAPEQIHDQPITTATDVYGLGCLLYELLTGVRAKENILLSSTSAGAAIRPPSDAVRRPLQAQRDVPRSNSASSWQALRGDLDTIVLRALHEDPGRRYPGAQSLSDDIERYLAQQPILARKDTALYRTRKFVRRHRLAVVTGIVMAIALVVAAAVSVRQAMLARNEALRATAEAARAEKERQRAVAARDFLIGLFEITENSGQPHDRLPTADKLLEEGAKRILGEFNDAPELKLDLMLSLARMQFRYGNNDSAEQLVKESLAISDAVLIPKDEQWLGTRRGWAAILMRKPGRSIEAAELLADSIRRHREAGAEDNKTLVAALGALGFAYLNTDRRDEAIAATREGVEVARRSRGTSPKRVQQALGRYVELLIATGRWDRVASVIDENLELAEQVYGKQHQDYASAAALKAEFLARRLHRYEEAERSSREAVAVLEAIFDKPTVELNFALSTLGDILLRSGKFDQAEVTYEKLLQTGEQLAGPKSGYVSAAVYGLARVSETRGDLAGAEKLYRRALEVREESGNQQSKIADIQDGLAQTLRKQGRNSEAERVLRNGIEVARRLRGAASLPVAMLSGSLALILARQGNVQEAESFLEQALSIFEHDPGADIDDLAETKIIKCEILNIQKKYEEAATLSAALLAQLGSSAAGDGRDFELQARAWKQLGTAQQGQGRNEEAIASFDTAKINLQKISRADSSDLKDIEGHLSRLRSHVADSPISKPHPP